MGSLYNQYQQNIFRKKLRHNLTAAELKLWYFVKNKQVDGFKFRRQFGIGKFIIDFYCPESKLAVEIDGDSHFDLKTKARDYTRDKYLKSFKINVLRFNNSEVIENIEGVIEKIRSYLIRPPLPLLTKEGKNKKGIL